MPVQIQRYMLLSSICYLLSTYANLAKAHLITHNPILDYTQLVLSKQSKQLVRTTPLCFDIKLLFPGEQTLHPNEDNTDAMLLINLDVLLKLSCLHSQWKSKYVYLTYGIDSFSYYTIPQNACVSRRSSDLPQFNRFTHITLLYLYFSYWKCRLNALFAKGFFLQIYRVAARPFTPTCWKNIGTLPLTCRCVTTSVGVNMICSVSVWLATCPLSLMPLAKYRVPFILQLLLLISHTVTVSPASFPSHVPTQPWMISTDHLFSNAVSPSNLARLKLGVSPSSSVRVGLKCGSNCRRLELYMKCGDGGDGGRNGRDRDRVLPLQKQWCPSLKMAQMFDRMGCRSFIAFYWSCSFTTGMNLTFFTSQTSDDALPQLWGD